MNNLYKRRFKDEIYGQFARLGKALSSGRRLELVDLLAQGERTVEDVAHEAGMTVANTSQHLQVLRRANLVETRHEGSYVYYRLANESVFRLWQALRDLGEERIAEIDRIVRDYMEGESDLEPVGLPEMLTLLKNGRVTVLDVRQRLEFDAGHIEGARSIPIEELEARLQEIPPDTPVVAYCRGPYCVYADEAVARLRHHGIAARRLALGFPDWRAAGLPVGPGVESKDTSDTPN